MSSQSLVVDRQLFLLGFQLSLIPVLLVWTKLDHFSIIWEFELWELGLFSVSPPFNFVTVFGQSGHVVGLVASLFSFLGLLLSASLLGPFFGQALGFFKINFVTEWSMVTQ